jgi:omega-6 fatty acid desaturase (delta-12 desaturase)
MRTGHELIEASRPFANENRARSWAYFWTTLAVMLVLYAATVWNLHWSARVASSLLAGLVTVRMFILYHDFQHGAILRGSKLATVLMSVYGLFVMQPPSVWRRSHNYHHKHNAKIAGASIGSYPVMTVEDYRRATPARRFGYAAARHPLTILLAYLTIFLYGMLIKSIATSPTRHWDSIVSLVLQAVLVTFALGVGSEVLVLTLLLPQCISFVAGAYLFYAQHNFPDIQLRPREEWEYTYAALYSSSYMEMSRIMHWFTGNIGYHHVHHLNARIPFYRLPEAMEAIPELLVAGRTSLRPADVRRAFSLKLWDPAEGRMVGFRRG